MPTEKKTVLLLICIHVLAGAVGLVHFAHYLYGPSGIGLAASHFISDDSMAPVLNLGDVVTVAPRLTGSIFASYETGDIICFRLPSDPTQTVVSRAVEEVPGGLRTKSDNSTSPDPWIVTDDELVGEVVEVNPMGWRIVTIPFLSIGVTIAFLAALVLFGVLILTKRRIQPPAGTVRPNMAKTGCR